MFSIDFPKYQFDLKTLSGKKSIFDIIRKKYVAATPEEFVRQHIIHYLVNEKFYPKALLAVEMPLTVNTMKRRCDIVAFKSNQPLMIVECKAPSIKLNQNAFDRFFKTFK